MARRTNELSIEELSIINSPKIVKEIDFQTALSLFVDDCLIRNLRPQTIQYYKNELSVFYKILREKDYSPAPTNITKDQIKSIIPRIKVKGLQTVSINTRLRAIRAFLNFLHCERHIKDNPLNDIKLLKDRRKVVETFTNEQLGTLFN
ncbi:tyrosine recombinase XerC [Heyndrickxia sporothermodurans]|uniref:site-specific integrase n=1 Tax=Heyndrickxia sporothermodurans TaxID=46224 RepID=UPI000AC152A3|nr:site-specific integrase [Heyndrickxia sporothermodurans]